MKQCKNCLKFKEITEFFQSSKYKDKLYYRGECKICTPLVKDNEKYKKSQQKYRTSDEYKEKRKVYRQLDHIKKHEREYEKLNRNTRNAHKREIYKNRYHSDPIHKLIHLCRKRTCEMLKNKRWYKSNKFKQYIGCDLEFLKQHIESQFLPGMSWENHGVHGWHLDHRVPLDSATSPEELYKLCHYTNLQPLWAKDNLKKSNKVK